MSKNQVMTIGVLAVIACVVFTLLAVGVFATMFFTSNEIADYPATVPANLNINQATPLPPTSTPEPSLADFQKLVNRFEWNHSFTNWRTAPGLDYPILIGENEAGTATIRIYGNPVKRVKLELDYSLSGNGAATYINDVIRYTLPEEYQNEFVQWFRSNPDAEWDERQFGDRTIMWSAEDPNYWLMRVQFSELD
jgi:hypothetical protein